MFSKASGASARGGAPGLSFIGPEMIVSGDLNSTAQLHVDGTVQGDVRCAHLCQGKQGVITGNIHADEVRLSGLVEGQVNAASVILEPSARIRGDVDYRTISIAAGAQVEGRLTRVAPAEPSDSNVVAPLFSVPPAAAAG